MSNLLTEKPEIYHFWFKTKKREKMYQHYDDHQHNCPQELISDTEMLISSIYSRSSLACLLVRCLACLPAPLHGPAWWLGPWAVSIVGICFYLPCRAFFSGYSTVSCVCSASLQWMPVSSQSAFSSRRHSEIVISSGMSGHGCPMVKTQRWASLWKHNACTF